VVAQHCEGLAGWSCWQELSVDLAFKVGSVMVETQGVAHIKFTASGNHYTWRRVKTAVMIRPPPIGPWVDHYGEMTLVNHRTGDSCNLTFKQHSYTNLWGTPRRVEGTVWPEGGRAEWRLSGTWDHQMEARQEETGTTKVLWKKRPNEPKAERYYNFSQFACQLNEPEAGTAPTDSRLRPDQRLLEDGRWEEAGREKVRLEEKQRAARRDGAERSARWFRPEPDPQDGGRPAHRYTGGYWRAKGARDWRGCPDIF
jgi:hypothetical protein